MDINIECSEIMDAEYSQFFDGNSQICLNEESFAGTPQGNTATGTVMMMIPTLAKINNQVSNQLNLSKTEKQATLFNYNSQPATLTLPMQNEEEIKFKDEFGGSVEISMIKVQVDEIALLSDEPKRDNKQSNIDIPKIEEINEELPKEEVQIPIKSDNPIPANKQWAKVQITKRRTSNNAGAMNGVNTTGNATDKNTSMFKSSHLPTKISENHQQSNKITTQQNQILNQVVDQQQHNNSLIPKQQKIEGVSLQKAQTQQESRLKRKLTETCGILPVFDCLYCCQEHFVLQKVNEQLLTQKYVKSPNYTKLWTEIYLSKRYFNLLAKSEYNLSHLINEEQNEQQQVEQIPKIEESQNIINKIIIQQQQQKENYSQPKVRKLIDIQMSSHTNKLNLIRKPSTATDQNDFIGQGISVIKPEKSLVAAGPVDTLSNDMQLNMMENHMNFFVQNAGLDASNFGCINLRTRNQQLRLNISFESEYHNIYDPSYSSEEQDNSSSLLGDSSENGEEEEEEYDDEEEEEDLDGDDEQCSDEGEDESQENEDEHIIEEDENDESQDDDEDEEEEKQSSLSNDLIQDHSDASQLHTLIVNPLQLPHNQLPSHIHLPTSQDEMMDDDNNPNKCSISSIEQQVDEDGFGTSDDEAAAGAEAQQPMILHSNNLNIQENFPIEGDDSKSERYTFGCITPKQHEFEEEQQKVTFSNCHGDNSLSPVRILEKDMKHDLSNSNQKNAMLLIDHSPIEYNLPRQIQIGRITNEDLMINSTSYNDGLSKINFYPSQLVDSIDLQNNTQHLQQQKSYESEIMMMRTPLAGGGQYYHNHHQTNALSYLSKPTNESIKQDLQQLIDVTGDDCHNTTDNIGGIEHNVVTQCYTNTGTNDLQPSQIMQAPTSQSFTGITKYKHQKLLAHHTNLPLQQQHVLTHASAHLQNNCTLDSNSTTSKPKFLIKQEQLSELLKKAQNQKINNGKNANNQKHLASFDSMVKQGVMKIQQQNMQQQPQQQFKQKTQALCTPLDTEIIIPQGAFKQHNVTTINQAGRRQNNNSNLGIAHSTKTTTTTTGGQMTQKNSDMNQQQQIIFNKNEHKTSCQQVADYAKNKQTHQKLIDNQYFQEYNQQSAVRSTTAKGSAMKQLGPQPSHSPNIFLKDKKFSQHSQALSQLNFNQLSKKDLNQLRTAMCSSRYSSTSTNTANFNNIFKQLSIDKDPRSQISQATIQNQTMKKKSKTKSGKTKKGETMVNNLVGNAMNGGIQANLLNAEITTKKVKKSKVNKKQKSINQQIYNDYYQNNHASNMNTNTNITHINNNQDFQNYLNVCNFSNDYSIPSTMLSQMPISQKSNSLNTARANQNSKIMYTSIQDGKNIFSSAMNSTNIQDTSNNNPYGQEMSTTISNGGLSNSNILHQTTTHNHLSTTRRQGMNSTTVVFPQNKLNGSIDELQLQNFVNLMNQPKSGRRDSNLNINNSQGNNGAADCIVGRLSQRGSMSLLRNQNYTTTSNVTTNSVCKSKINIETINTNGAGANNGQFSFSQSSLKLNQTTNLNKKSKKKNKKSKNGVISQDHLQTHKSQLSHQQIVNNNTTSSNQTLKGSSQQSSQPTQNTLKPKNSGRTRSTSKSNIIKTDHPSSHLLLLQQQKNQQNQQQVLVKNKQILLNNQQQSNTFIKSGNVSMSSNIQTAEKKYQKKLLLLQSQHDQSERMNSLNGRDPQQLHSITKINHPYSIHDRKETFTSELNKFYGTSKLSNVTSPLRPMPIGKLVSGNGFNFNNAEKAHKNSDFFMTNKDLNVGQFTTFTQRKQLN